MAESSPCNPGNRSCECLVSNNPGTLGFAGFATRTDNGVMKMTAVAASLAIAAAIAACAADVEEDDVPPAQTAKPEIVEVFACSDNCPGPEQQYIKRVYKDVTDEAECRRLGGKPFTVVGWTERRFCEAP